MITLRLSNLDRTVIAASHNCITIVPSVGAYQAPAALFYPESLSNPQAIQSAGASFALRRTAVIIRVRSTDLTPKPTIYKDIYFRSRLEVRWAIFFDALNLRWEYEPRTVTLNHGIPWDEWDGFEDRGRESYIPDFWFPQLRLWAEVKPVEFTPKERRKCMRLRNVTGYDSLMLVGPPARKEYECTNGKLYQIRPNWVSEIDYTNALRTATSTRFGGTR